MLSGSSGEGGGGFVGGLYVYYFLRCKLLLACCRLGFGVLFCTYHGLVRRTFGWELQKSLLQMVTMVRHMEQKDTVGTK